jgi:succinyl-diaminopimelate desuccinylase
VAIRFEGVNAGKQARLRSSLFIARPTLNVGTVHRGLKGNMAPDLCPFMDIRLPADPNQDKVLGFSQDILNNSAQAEFGK